MEPNEEAYKLICQLAEAVALWFEHGYHLRDSQGQAILTLDEWERAAREERWTARPLQPEQANQVA